MDEYKRFIFSGILLISLGVVFNTTLKDSIGSLGIVFIAIGELFFIISMAKKERKIRQKIINKNGYLQLT